MKILISRWFKVGLPVMGIVIVFSFISIAQAEVLVKKYKVMKVQDNRTITFYIDGAVSGMSWVNTRLTHSGKPPLYCQPGKLALETDDYSRILDDEIKWKEKMLGFKEIQDFPIEVLLLEGLIRRFPCNQK